MTVCKFTCILSAAAFAGLVICAGCGSDPAPVDGGVEPPDSGPPPDGGIRALCPALAEPACQRASDCGEEDRPVTMCPTCPSYNHGVCTFGACASLEFLGSGDPHGVRLSAAGFTARVQSFTMVTIVPETSGGQAVTCADVYEGRVSLTDGCYNIVDVRRFQVADLTPMGDVYTLTTTQLPARTPLLFVVHGYEARDTTGAPIAVSCTAYPGSEPCQCAHPIGGDAMRAVR
jgi:hypothetical protein